jgi:DNA-binding XRE family transcriptional regulator
MENKEFSFLRQILGKTQIELSELLGTSIKAIQSYEQGWREIPAHAERQLLFLVSRKLRAQNKGKKCWRIKKCPQEQKINCPAYEFDAGDLCWFINGTTCMGRPQKNWNEKIKICRTCEVFRIFCAPTV